MKIDSLRRYIAVALPLMGSAILLYSCKAATEVSEPVNTESMMTEYSEDMSMTMSENGKKSYHFEAPIIEGYTMARDPYREFRKGIKITTYENDSISSVSATLVANYAIFYEKRKLWEAKGDVVVKQANGRTLYTSQLFWNQASHTIYSNVDSKIVDGDEIYNCEGFDSDESMTNWSYRKLKGVTYLEDSQLQPSSDSSAQESASDL